MYRFALLVIVVTLLTSSVVHAASYEKTDGIIVNPILDTSGSPHSSYWLHLRPNADLTYANLYGADLTDATLAGANLHQTLLPSAMPSLPVINGAVVIVANTLAVSGSVQVDTGGNLSITSDSFTAAGVNMQGGTVHGMFGLDLDEIGDISGHGQLFGHVDLGTSGTIAGSGAGLELFGHVSGSGTLSGTTLFGNLNIGSSPGVVTLENTTLSASSTTTFEVAGTDSSQFDQLILIGSVALNGTAQITFDNFTAELSDTFQLLDLTNGTASSWFSSVVAPVSWPSWAWHCCCTGGGTGDYSDSSHLLNHFVKETNDEDFRTKDVCRRNSRNTSTLSV